MQHEGWQCTKCGHDAFDTDIFQATGGTLAKLFDIQNKKFTTVTCQRCTFTEIYKTDSSNLDNVLDYFVG
ncbi:MAG TPA: zinc ribbon domain-containing protein [Planctomycetaceae bacterium]|nr:zinc ribbon domain-containing protein [Planctomycetaceae bacterium]